MLASNLEIAECSLGGQFGTQNTLSCGPGLSLGIIFGQTCVFMRLKIAYKQFPSWNTMFMTMFDISRQRALHMFVSSPLSDLTGNKKCTKTRLQMR